MCIMFSISEIMSSQELGDACHLVHKSSHDDDPHDYCLECLGEEHALHALKDAECEHCESLLQSLCSAQGLHLFRRGKPLRPH